MIREDHLDRARSPQDHSARSTAGRNNTLNTVDGAPFSTGLPRSAPQGPMKGIMRWIGALRRNAGSRAGAVAPLPRNLEWELLLCAAIQDRVLVALRYRDASGRE